MDSVQMQKLIKDNSQDLRDVLRDLRDWEETMRRKDAQLSESEDPKPLPPIRSKREQTKQNAETRPSTTAPKRNKTCDYAEWEKFDADSVCRRLDEIEQTPETAYDREAALELKEEGNRYVREKQWEKALRCYDRAITTYPSDSTFYANRALCHTKLDNLHMAEQDCSTAIDLDANYVKAYYRRATIRVSLNRYHQAKDDLAMVLKLDPSNVAAERLLEEISSKVAKMEKKCLPSWVPQRFSSGDFDTVEVIEKPPHRRCKEPLKRVPITEANSPLKKPKEAEIAKEVKEDSPDRPLPAVPLTSCQFVRDWQDNRSAKFRSRYLLQIKPDLLPKIFEHCLELPVLSDVLDVLRSEFVPNGQPILQYMLHLSRIERCRILSMFLEESQKKGIAELLDHCKRAESMSEEEESELRSVFTAARN